MVASSSPFPVGSKLIRKGLIANRLAFALAVGFLVATPSKAFCFQQGAENGVVIVQQKFESGMEEATVGLVIAKRKGKTFVQIPRKPSFGPRLPNWHKSQWSIVLNAGTPDSQTVPAKFFGIEVIKKGHRVVNCILLSTESRLMPPPIINLDFNLGESGLSDGEQVSVLKLLPKKTANGWDVSRNLVTAKVRTEKTINGKSTRLESEDLFTGGFVFQDDHMLGSTINIAGVVRRRNENEPLQPDYRVTPLLLVTDFGVPKFRNQYTIQKSIDSASVTLSVVVNWNDPFDGLKSFKGKIHIPSVEQTKTATSVFRKNQRIPQNVRTESVEFRRVPDDQKDAYKQPANNQREAAKHVDYHTDSRWVAEIKLSYSTNGESRVLILERELELRNPKLKDKLEKKSAGVISFKPVFARPDARD